MTNSKSPAATYAVGGRLPDRLSVPVAPVVIGAALLALLLAHAAHALFGVGGTGLDSFFGQLVYGILVVSAALGCLARAALVREERAGWALIGAGLLASAAAGQIYFSTSGAPAFSIGDGLNVTFHLATFAGLVVVARERLEHIERGLWLDAAIGALVAAALWAVLLEPLVHRTVVDGWSSAITIAYPLADLLVVVALIAVSAATGWRPGRSLALLTAGFALAAVADGAYAHQAAAGTYVDAGPLDSLFLAATLMIALAAWCRPRATAAAVAGGRVFVFPAAFGLVALAIVVTYQLLHAGTLGFALATTALVAVIARVILPVAALAEETRKLRASEARLSEANRRSRFGRWEWDPETDSTVASSEIYSILGLDADQGLSLATFIGMLDPEDGEAVQGLVTRALETGAPYEFEYPLHTDAVDRIVHVRGWRELGGNGRPLLFGTLQDVTERVRSAQALRESEERFKRSFEDAPTGMALTSVAPGEEGRLTRVNAAGCAMFGYSEEGLLGKGPDDLSHPDDLAVGRRGWRRVLRGDDDVFSVEQRFRRSDGSTFWGVSHMSLVRDRTGKPLYGINQLEDITARRNAELARKRIIESALDAIISIDAAGIVTEFSPAAERLFGHSREEALGRELAELVIPEALRERHRAGLARAAAGEDTIIGQRLEVPAVHADGRELEVELSISRSDDDPLTFTAFVRDIGARRDAERATRHAEERFRHGFEDSAVAMLIGSTGGKWERVNRAYCEMLGYTEEELLRLGLEGITHPDDVAIDLDVTPRLGRGEQYRHQREKRYIHADGHTVWGLVTVTSIPGYEGGPGYIYSQVQDISARKRAEESLQAVLGSVADGICALDEEGRLTFMNPAAERLLGYREEELQGRDLRGAIHHLDADGNPRPGEAPSPLDGRGTDEVVRVEDDVFVCGDGSLLPVAYSVAPLTTETGRRGSVVAFRDITEHKAELVRREEEFEALRWVARIRRALNEERFVLYAQPIVDLASDEVVQEELLIRMIGDEGEVITPGKFLPAAEEYGLIEDIDIWVIGRAAELAADGRSVQINLSGRSIGSANVLQAIEHALKRTGAQPESLIFEITETTLNQDIEEAQVFAERLTELGCGFALDDFGTGYGTFTYLRRLPIRYLKIDIVFVRELLESEIDRHLVEAVVSLAHTLGQKTVAEGVEDEETLERLREIGVDYAQGYLLGRPAPCALAPTPALSDV